MKFISRKQAVDLGMYPVPSQKKFIEIRKKYYYHLYYNFMAFFWIEYFVRPVYLQNEQRTRHFKLRCYGWWNSATMIKRAEIWKKKYFLPLESHSVKNKVVLWQHTLTVLNFKAWVFLQAVSEQWRKLWQSFTSCLEDKPQTYKGPSLTGGSSCSSKRLCEQSNCPRCCN